MADKWCTWENEDKPDIKHVAQIDDRGYLATPHVLTPYCICEPETIQTAAGVLLIVHRGTQ